MKHTKGKWTAFTDNANGFGVTNGDTVIAVAGESDLPKNEANANLIASAPDMLKALNDIMCYFSEYEEDYNEKLECFEYARKVIAKAEGEIK